MTDLDSDPIALSVAQQSVVSHGLSMADPTGVVVADLVQLLPWAAEHRLVGLLHEATISLGTTVPDEINDVHLALLRHVLGVEVDTCRAVNALGGVGIDAVVFKGVAAAHLDYPDPGLRNFYDVDLLVPRSQLAEAAACLESAGWSRSASKLGPQWEARFARAVQLISPAGIELDLHAALGPGYFGVRLEHDAMMCATERFELGGVDLCAFSAEGRLLTSAYALVLSRGGNLRLLRDVAQQVLVSKASHERAAVLAGEGDVVIAAALRMVDKIIELPSDVRAWAGSVASSRAQRRGLALARRAQRDGWRSDALGELLALGVADRARYVAGVARSRVRWRPT